MTSKKNVFKEINEVIKLSNKSDRLYFPLVIFKSLVTASLPFIAIIYSALILDSIIDGLSKAAIMAHVYQMITFSSILLILRTSLTFFCDQKNNLINLRLDSEISKKTLNLDFEQLESQEIKDKISRAAQGVNSNGGIGTFIRQIGLSIENIISFIYSFILILALFKKVDVFNPDTITKIFNNPLIGVGIMVLIFASLLLNFRILSKVNKLQYGIFKDNVVVNRLFGYFTEASIDYKLSKEVRIYQINKLISDNHNKYAKIFLKKFQSFSTVAGGMFSKVGLLNHIILFAAYAIIGIKAILGLISVGSVLLLVSAITSFNTAITQFIINMSSVTIQIKYLSLYEEYLKLDTAMYKGTLPIEKRNDSQYDFEFKNVSFHYPNSEEIILKNVSMKIEVGKKLAIVGPNGAGKTTFIKLLCRLYDPTEGEILLNGIDIKKYDYKEYINLVSVVFQDFRLFSSTIKDNVTSGQSDDDNKVLEYLYQAGLTARIEKLENGIDTYLYSNFSEQGIEVSGGEAQKIAIARALYKDTPLVILDEPTSALDPISEYEIYTKFDTLVENKTAIYISHRMSSCRFCNSIIVFDNGEIIQSGNHDELLANTDGLYFNMWSAQAKYYNT
ncbi:MAG: ABC transporter ATP-binding protein [Tenericutes bacterium]|nr:ABC transporter ATP-binding protein [Mycoplasmatota bacterium]